MCALDRVVDFLSGLFRALPGGRSCSRTGRSGRTSRSSNFLQQPPIADVAVLFLIVPRDDDHAALDRPNRALHAWVIAQLHPEWGLKLCTPVGARSSGARKRAVSGKMVQARAGVAPRRRTFHRRPVCPRPTSPRGGADCV